MNTKTINNRHDDRLEHDRVTDAWIDEVNLKSVVPIHNQTSAKESVRTASRESSILPFILNFCPAIENLERPNEKGQTRQLIPLDQRSARLDMCVSEIISFMVSIKRTLGLNPDLFLIFADTLEAGADKMFVNSKDINEISDDSLRGIRKAFFDFDQKNSGLLQKNQIRIPRVFKQSALATQAGKSGIDIHRLQRKKELEMLDPNNPLFLVWLKHLKLTREDESFVSTAWQNSLVAQTIWNRLRFMLAQCMVDAEVNPKLMFEIRKSLFRGGGSDPIFITSTTRKAGILLEIDGFSCITNSAVMSPFHNIGRWLDEPRKSPWI